MQDHLFAVPDGEPLEVLLNELRLRRARGQTFAAAWGLAVRVVLVGCEPEARREWLAVLASTRSEWEAAWHGRPSPVGGLPRLAG